MSDFSTCVMLRACNECEEPIFPGEKLLHATYRGPDGKGGMKDFRVILCEDCGTLYKESQEYGSDAEETQLEQSPSSR